MSSDEQQIAQALDHVPAVVQAGANTWRVYCLGCSNEAENWVPRCLIEPSPWPATVLVNACEE